MGPFPLVGLVLTWFIWGRNKHFILHSNQLSLFLTDFAVKQHIFDISSLFVLHMVRILGFHMMYVMTAMLVPLNKEKAAMLVPRPNPPGI